MNQLNININQNKQLKKYLLGNNNNLKGSIIRLCRTQIENKALHLTYSIILYFDHRTGRIERYLFNSALFMGNYNDMLKSNTKILTELAKNNNLTSSFMFPLILSKLDINVTDNHSSLTQISYGVFLLSLIALFCLINIIGYMIVNIIINKVDYEKRYPRLSKIINYYRKMSLIYISIDIILCLICLLLLVFF